MKKCLSLIGISMIISAINAQTTDPWKGSVELNPVFSTIKGADHSFNLNLTATKKVADYFGVGAGVGINETWNFGQAPTIPIFARFQAEDYSKKLSPFLTFDIGYGLNTDNFDYSGLIINPTIGVRYGAFSLGVGYYGYKPNKNGVKISNSVNIRIGYNFGYHYSKSPFAEALRDLEFSIDLGSRFPLGGGVNYYNKEDHMSTTIWGEEWLYEEYIYDKNCKYTVAPDLTLSLIYPVTDNFYAGVMLGYSYMFSNDSGTYTYRRYDYPNVLEKEWITSADFESKDEYGYPNGHHDSLGDSNQSIQVGARFKYKLREFTFAKRFYPYLQFDLGYCYTDSDDSNSFFYAPSVGLSMDVNKGKHSINLGVSYVPQKLKTFTNVEVNDNRLCADKEYKDVGSLRISLGYSF